MDQRNLRSWICIFFFLGTAAWGQEPAPMATVRITVASRNGGDMLAQVISELSSLRKEAIFQAALSREEVNNSGNECLSLARTDPSGRLFDLAKCADAWPAIDKAPASQEFEKQFRREVFVQGVQAFPAVKVIPFQLPLRLNKQQFSARTWQLNREPETGRLQPSPAFQEKLCDRRVTFIDPRACEIHVVSRLDDAKTDIYVTQTGYQVYLVNPISLNVATALGKRLNQRFEAAQEAVPGSITISIFRSEEGVQQQSPGDNANPPPPAKNIADLWSAMGTAPDALRLFGVTGPNPPAILIFDKRNLQEPLSMPDWFKDFTSRAVAQPPTDCPAELDAIGHSDAVASVLFPESIIRHLNGLDEGASMPDTGTPPMGWTGFFLSAAHFTSRAAVESQTWWQGGVADPGQPIIALVVYNSEYESPEFNAAKNAVEGYLKDKSNLVVISAPRKRFDGQKQDFDTSPVEPTDDPGAIDGYCQKRPWPSCLGRHPRVLVVASSDYPSAVAGHPTLLHPNDYVLGASTVRLAAPGGNIPVARGCNSNTSKSWNVISAQGTSFAAPIVALVLSRLVQLGELTGDEIVTPELAIWRILATAKPFDTLTPTGTPNVATQFGELDAGRALKGASRAESGEENNAVLYEKNGTGTETAGLAVVMPFPWNDVPKTTDRRAQMKYGIEADTRSVISFQVVRDDDTVGPTGHVQFDRMIRIVRRPNDQLAGVPLFDIFFSVPEQHTADGKKLAPAHVTTRNRVRLGAGTDPDGQGFCRSDAVLKGAQRDTPDGYQAQASCLYAWRADKSQFERLDMATVTDIVFPLLHLRSNFPARINPANLKAVVGPQSPWRDVFCETMPRRLVTKLLVQTYKQQNPEALCKR